MAQQRDCLCGCGRRTSGKYCPGHDQKLRAAIEKAVGGLEALHALVERHIGRPISGGSERKDKSMAGWGDFFVKNARGKAERVDWIRHVEETEPGTLEIAFTEAKYATEVIEIAVARPRIPPEWAYAFKAERKEQFTVADDDPRREDPWFAGNSAVWFRYHVLEEWEPEKQD